MDGVAVERSSIAPLLQSLLSPVVFLSVPITAALVFPPHSDFVLVSCKCRVCRAVSEWVDDGSTVGIMDGDVFGR